MTENSMVRLIKNLDVTDLDGEKVMIDFSSGKYFLLKGAANEISRYIRLRQIRKTVVTLLMVALNNSLGGDLVY